MAKLVNTFSWSTSAASDFEECRRKRYWSKYAMWGGWERDAPDIQRRAYRLNKMESRHTLRGRAVEKAVIWVLREKQQDRDVTVEQAYQEIARPYLNARWKESRDKLWRRDPKRYCCLHEHYYAREEDPPEREWTAALTENTKQCIAHFIERVLPRLAHVTPEQEVPVRSPEQGGQPESFAFEGLTIYAIPDYVYRIDDQWHIHDWKAGRQKEEHRDQVGLYGLWAHSKHGADPRRIFVYLEYLRDGVMAYEQLSPEALEQVRDRIRASVADMADYLVDADTGKNEPLPMEEWELAPTRRPCRTCGFYELCEAELAPS